MFDQSMKISLIGPGVMAEAIACNLVRADLIQAKQIVMSGPRENRLQDLHAKHGFTTSTDNKKAIENSAIIILCVKPQSLS